MLERIDDVMIGDNLYEYYFNRKRKRGYHVIGWKLVVSYFILIIAMGISATWFIMSKDLWLALIFFILFSSLKVLSKKIDKVLDIESKQATPEAKELIYKYLHCNLGFNHSKIFKELAAQLQIKAKESKKIYDLTPQINMILPIVVLLLSLLSQNLPENLPGILLLASIIIIVSLNINPALNVFTDVFLNIKPEKMMELSRLVNEIYLDELIKENNVYSDVKEIQQSNIFVKNYSYVFSDY